MKAERRLVRLAPLAEEDLEDIWTYTARTWSVDQADRYHADIIEAIEGLSRGERGGRDIGDIRPGYLKYSVGRHLLFYRLTETHLNIIRILHQRMDVEARL